MRIRPKIGISACLLGHPVRYNGDHKRQDWIVGELSRFVTFVPVCPEMEMGLGAPRETLKLEGALVNPRIIGHQSGRDYTELAHSTSAKLVDRLEAQRIDGYVLKKNSPSCGLERVLVYRSGSKPPVREGRGLFAARLAHAFPGLPIIEEGRLMDAEQRERFVTQVFAWDRLREVAARISALQEFHRDYKLLLLARDPKAYTRLGQIASNPNREPARRVVERYREEFMPTLAKPARPARTVNALEHILGYFKDELGTNEKQQILETFAEYRRGEIPLAAPLTLLSHLVKKHSIAYLQSQTLFEPYPKGLRLEWKPSH